MKIGTSNATFLVLICFSRKREKEFQYFRYHLHVDFPCQSFQRSPLQSFRILPSHPIHAIHLLASSCTLSVCPNSASLQPECISVYSSVVMLKCAKVSQPQLILPVTVTPPLRAGPVGNLLNLSN